MTDISKEAVEREICTPIINYVADGRGMSEDTLAGIIAKSRAMSARIAELEAKLDRLRQDRPFVIGFNEGYKLAIEQAVDVFDHEWRENSATKRAAILALIAKDTSHDG